MYSPCHKDSVLVMSLVHHSAMQSLLWTVILMLSIVISTSSCAWSVVVRGWDVHVISAVRVWDLISIVRVWPLTSLDREFIFDFCWLCVGCFYMWWGVTQNNFYFELTVFYVFHFSNIGQWYRCPFFVLGSVKHIIVFSLFQDQWSRVGVFLGW